MNHQNPVGQDYRLSTHWEQIGKNLKAPFQRQEVNNIASIDFGDKMSPSTFPNLSNASLNIIRQEDPLRSPGLL